MIWGHEAGEGSPDCLVLGVGGGRESAVWVDCAWCVDTGDAGVMCVASGSNRHVID